MLDNSLIVLIKRKEKLLNILNVFQNNEEEEKQLYKLLENDYYSLFLNKNFSKSKDKKNAKKKTQLIFYL